MQVTPRDVTGTPTVQTTTETPQATVAKAEVPKETPKPEVDPKLEIYARREREFRQIQRQAAQKLQELEQKQQDYQQNYIPKDQYEKTFQNVETIANEMLKRGMTPQQLNEYFLSQPSTMDPAYQKVQALEAKIADLEGKLTKQTEQLAETKTNEYQQALKQIDLEAKRLVTTDPTFKAIKGEGAHKAVTKLIEETFKNGYPGEFDPGEVMPIERAAEIVNQHILDEAKRLQTYFEQEQKPEAPPPQDKHPIIAKQPQIKTITNNVKESTKPLSPRDRAILAFQGKL